MLKPIISLSVVVFVLFISEYFWRTKKTRGEMSRKFVHIVVGSFIATWAFYMTKQQIQVLSLILLIGVVISERMSVFRSVHGVRRKTLGEPLFAVAVGLTATITTSPWIFASAILHLSLADGFAAVVGTKYGHNSSYSVLGQYKTLLGTMTFYLLSCMITTWVILISPAGISHAAWPVIVWLPLLAAITENMAINGIDNLAVPIIVAFSLEIVKRLYS